MNPREETFYNVANREIRRILIKEPALLIKRKPFTSEEVALAKSCLQGIITHEEFVKQRIACGKRFKKIPIREILYKIEGG